jgi:hypothetical protein
MLIAVFCLSVAGMAGQESQTTNADQCRQYTKPTINSGAAGETVKLDTLLDHKEQYIGKTVTTEGEMHRVFTDHVFTIEDDDFIRDDDLLIISNVPVAETVVPLENSVEPGKDVRVTGFVHEYDRQKLECLYGPLHLESREGHSFTKGPVLIVEKVQAVNLETPPEPELEKPAPVAAEPEPAPAPAPEAEPVAEEGRTLPATASGLPLTGLLGLLSLVTAYGVQYFRR